MLDTEGSRPTGTAAPRHSAGEDLLIAAEDGRLLAASLFLPPAAASATAPLTVIGGGTGIARRYYARFAA